ncbi:EVE domain-containing protein [Geminisphaera colitermitum]|uniref:EVE domain-containing protein n=1 Tax=Geminisphaera colitermitum TaxID=1148786 RepID=UPI000158CABC|nr:EVE domain-containing protein [Geminisphaera colitermitum]
MSKIQYWLVKQEPESYAWETFVRDGRTTWDGVRNFQARNNLKAMREGDRVLFYASVSTKAVLGTARVSRTAFPDPTVDADEARSGGREGWLAVELEAGQALAKPVTLEAIKAEASLTDIALLRQSRLSVMPLTREEFETIVALGK